MPEEIMNSDMPTFDQINQSVEQSHEQSVEETTVQQEPQTEEQKPLTLEDYRAIAQQEALKIARQEAMKIAQSQVGKSENRIRKEIMEQVEALKKVKNLIGLTDEQFEQKKQEIAVKAWTSDAQDQSAMQEESLSEQSNQTNEQIAPDQAFEAGVKFIHSEAVGILKTMGVSIKAGDPEFKELDSKLDAILYTDKPIEEIQLMVRRAAYEAGLKKANRENALRKNASARVVGGGKGTGGQTSSGSASDLWKQAYKK